MDPSKVSDRKREVDLFLSQDDELVMSLRDYFRSLIEEFGSQVYRDDLSK